MDRPFDNTRRKVGSKSRNNCAPCIGRDPVADTVISTLKVDPFGTEMVVGFSSRYGPVDCAVALGTSKAIDATAIPRIPATNTRRPKRKCFTMTSNRPGL